MRKVIITSLLLATLPAAGAQQHVTPDAIAEKMQWFADAKLGIFIHWGIYSVNGVDESWAFYNKKMPYDDYMQQLAGFTASRYDPAAWAELIERSGARYAVITTKHHDGVALWDTRMAPGTPLRPPGAPPAPPDALAPRSDAPPPQPGAPPPQSDAPPPQPGAPPPQSDAPPPQSGAPPPRSVVTSSPAGRDLIGPLFAELRQRGLKAGAYFSLIDWSDHHYPGFTRDSTRYAIQEDPLRWQRFLAYYQGQVQEIAAQLNPDLWWFDGDWEHSAEEWEAQRVRRLILAVNPRAIINGRLAGHGDYLTPEQNIPIETPAYPWWELCLTIGDAWGWQPQDTSYKSTHDLIAIFADVIGHGGNLLLDIGPREDGTIPPRHAQALEELGLWNAKHAEAVFGTRAGLPNGHHFGPTTLSPDSTTLYLFLPHGAGGSVEIKGLNNKVLSAEALGTAMPLRHRVVGKISWSKVPGLVFIDVPEEAADPWMTVLKVKLDGPVSLYRGTGGLF